MEEISSNEYWDFFYTKNRSILIDYEIRKLKIIKELNKDLIVIDNKRIIFSYDNIYISSFKIEDDYFITFTRENNTGSYTIENLIKSKYYRFDQLNELLRFVNRFK